MKALHATRKLWLETMALVTAAVLASMLAAPAFGQGKPPAQPGAAPCSPSQPAGSPGTPTVGAGQPHETDQPPSNLSDRLAQSDGVICPPAAVDPDIRLPAPETGKMPVIPPPGTPGGDPTIRPK